MLISQLLNFFFKLSMIVSKWCHNLIGIVVLYEDAPLDKMYVKYIINTYKVEGVSAFTVVLFAACFWADSSLYKPENNSLCPVGQFFLDVIDASVSQKSKSSLFLRVFNRHFKIYLFIN